MTFEFDYNTDTDEITIFYDGSFVVSAEYDGEVVTFHNFSKIEDEAIAKLLKSFCREVYKVVA